MTRIQETLQKLFEHHRIVFWYDTEGELRSEFDSMELADITLVEVNNNELGVKYRIAREEPKKRFLLYFPHEQPPDEDNWLLDLLLANKKFEADSVALMLADLGLPFKFRQVLEEHWVFFKSKNRVERLSKIAEEQDTPSDLRLKMLAVTCRCEPRLEDIVLTLLSDIGKRDMLNITPLFAEVERFKLAKFLWKRIEAMYAYSSDNPNLQDFLFSLFKSTYDWYVGSDTPTLNREARVLLKRWQDSAAHREAFEELADEVAEGLAIETDLESRHWQELVDVDVFRTIDRKILVDLRNGLLDETLNTDQVINACRERKNSFWFNSNKHLYEAVINAAECFRAIKNADLGVESLDSGLNKYCETYHLIDRAYRRFIYNWRICNQSTFLKDLYKKVENYNRVPY